MSALRAKFQRLGIKLIWRADDFLVPGIAVPFANCSIDRQYRRQKLNRDQALSDLTSSLIGWPESLEEARIAYDQELARRETIERKAVSLVSATGVSSGLITAAGVIGILVPREITNEGQIAVGAALLVPLICFVTGFFFAVQTWRVGPIELVDPATLTALSGESGARRSTRLAAERLVATQLNQLLTLMRVNYLSCAERWIIRGTVLIALAALTLLILATATGILTADTPR